MNTPTERGYYEVTSKDGRKTTLFFRPDQNTWSTPEGAAANPDIESWKPARKITFVATIVDLP